DECRALVERLGVLCSDKAACRQTHVWNQNVCAGSSHGMRVVDGEDIGGRQQLQPARDPYELHLEAEAHAGVFEVAAERPVLETDGREVLDAREAEASQLFEEDGHG